LPGVIGNASMKTLRKLIAILLLAAFGLPFAPQLFAATGQSESNLPACCRRNGKHHCMMSASEKREAASTKPEFRSPLDKCPYTPGTVVTSRHHADGLAASSVVYAELLSHPSVRPQTESKWRIARDRSRSKRGPPSLSSL
jgi:hypothetical protein